MLFDSFRHGGSTRGIGKTVNFEISQKLKLLFKYILNFFLSIFQIVVKEPNRIVEKRAFICATQMPPQKANNLHIYSNLLGGSQVVCRMKKRLNYVQSSYS